MVENWPEGLAEPPGPVDINGERWQARVVRDPASTAGALARPSEPAAGPSAATPVEGGAHGAAVVPPMPGKVIDVRVRDGDRVRKGDVLLVLEAMKMRNDVLSPADGVVERVSVRPGTNVRAKEPMLFVRPE